MHRSILPHGKSPFLQELIEGLAFFVYTKDFTSTVSVVFSQKVFCV